MQLLGDDKAVVCWFTHSPPAVGDRQMQAWFLNNGTVEGNRLTFDLLKPSGTDFGSSFDTGEIVNTVWGTAVFTFDDCSSGAMTYDSVLEGYGSGNMKLSRLTSLSGLACN